MRVCKEGEKEGDEKKEGEKIKMKADDRKIKIKQGEQNRHKEEQKMRKKECMTERGTDVEGERETERRGRERK